MLNPDQFAPHPLGTGPTTDPTSTYFTSRRYQCADCGVKTDIHRGGWRHLGGGPVRSDNRMEKHKPNPEIAPDWARGGGPDPLPPEEALAQWHARWGKG